MGKKPNKIGKIYVVWTRTRKTHNNVDKQCLRIHIGCVRLIKGAFGYIAARIIK